MTILEAVKMILKAIRPYRYHSYYTYALYHNLRYAFRRWGNIEVDEGSIAKIQTAIEDLPRYFGTN